MSKERGEKKDSRKEGGKEEEINCNGTTMVRKKRGKRGRKAEWTDWVRLAYRQILLDTEPCASRLYVMKR